MADAKFGIIIETSYKNAQAVAQARRDFDLLVKSIQANGNVSQTTAARIEDMKRSLDAAGKASKQLENNTKNLKDRVSNLKSGFSEVSSAMSALPGPASSAAARIDTLAQAATGLASKLPPMVAALAGVAVVAAAVGTAIATAALQAANYAEKLDILKDQTGLSSAELAGLKEAAVAQGKSFDDIRPAVDFFVRRLGDAARGAPDAVAAFEGLSISIRDTNGELRPTGDVLDEVGTKIRNMGTASERSAAAFDFFGRGGARSVSILTASLKDMAEAANRRGSVLDPATEKTLTRLDESLDSLKATVEAFKLQWIALAGVSVEPIVTKLDEFHKKLLQIVNDPKVKMFTSLIAWLSRDITDPFDKNRSTTAGSSPAKSPLESIVPMIPKGMANEMAIEAAARQREANERDYNTVVANATKARERQEQERLAFETAAIAHNTAGLTITGVPVAGLPTKEQLQDKAFEDAKKENDEFWQEMRGNIRKTKGDVKPDEKPGKTPAELAMEKNKKATEGFRTALDVLSTSLRGATLAAGFTGREFRNLMASMVASVMSLAAPALGPIGAIFSQVFSLFEAGGKVGPVGAATGLVTNGMRGRDSLHALVAGGERVLSVRRNDRFEQLLDSLSEGRSAGAARGSTTNNVSISLSVDPRMDARETERWVRGAVVPALRDEMGSGRFWNG